MGTAGYRRGRRRRDGAPRGGIRRPVHRVDAERDYADEIEIAAGIRIDRFDSLDAWKDAIAEAPALVAPDSGALHVAGTIGTPVVGVFPASAQFDLQVARWSPWAAPSRIVKAEGDGPRARPTRWHSCCRSTGRRRRFYDRVRCRPTDRRATYVPSFTRSRRPRRTLRAGRSSDSRDRAEDSTLRYDAARLRQHGRARIVEREMRVRFFLRRHVGVRGQSGEIASSARSRAATACRFKPGCIGFAAASSTTQRPMHQKTDGSGPARVEIAQRECERNQHVAQPRTGVVRAQRVRRRHSGEQHFGQRSGSQPHHARTKRQEQQRQERRTTKPARAATPDRNRSRTSAPDHA